MPVEGRGVTVGVASAACGFDVVGRSSDAAPSAVGADGVGLAGVVASGATVACTVLLPAGVKVEGRSGRV